MLSSPVSAVKGRGGRMWLRPLPPHRLLQAVLAIGAAGLSHRAPKLRIGQDALAVFAQTQGAIEGQVGGVRHSNDWAGDLGTEAGAQDGAGGADPPSKQPLATQGTGTRTSQ